MRFEDVEIEDFESMRTEIVQAGEPVYSIGCKSDFQEHVKMLEIEFSQRPLLLFYHAWLCVCIRREVDLKKSLARFFLLWREESSFLIEHLSSRWLVSACDTVVDYSEDALEVSYSMSVVLLVNTIKLYESEELMMFDEFGISYSSKVPTTRVSLFDGISAFRIGSGDMVKNMITRTCKIDSHNTTSYRVLMEIVQRVHRYNSVYRRAAKAHKNNRTRWWQDEQLFT